MKIVHMADLHLGKFYKGLYDVDFANSRREELWESFEKNISYIRENDIDVLLLAGDIYERDYFTDSDLNRFKSLLNSLDKTQVFMIAGNHDYLDENSPILNLDFNDNIHIFYSEKYFQIDDINLRVYGQSWKSKYDFTAKLDYDLDKNFLNILMLHASNIAGEKHYVDMRVFSDLGFDYVALGHIHLRQKLNKKTYYAGSPEPLSFKDLYDHGFIELELKKGFEPTITYVTNSLRKYINHELYIEKDQDMYEILSKIKGKIDSCKDDFNRLYLRGDYDDSAYLLKFLQDKLSYYYLEIIDQTENFMDIDKLYQENKNNLIGKFIKAVGDDKRALKYGLRALMEAKNEN